MSQKAIGKIFKEARKKKGLTQTELADKSGVHVNTYARVERGDQEPTFSTVKRVAKVLGLNLSELPD